MSVQVADFRLAPVSSNPINRAGEGHIHYLVNDKPAQGNYATPETSFTFRGLANGDAVAAELVNNDHTSLNPRVLATQKVGGGLPGFELALLAVGVAVALMGVRRRR